MNSFLSADDVIPASYSNFQLLCFLTGSGVRVDSAGSGTTNFRQEQKFPTRLYTRTPVRKVYLTVVWAGGGKCALCSVGQNKGPQLSTKWTPNTDESKDKWNWQYNLYCTTNIICFPKLREGVYYITANWARKQSRVQCDGCIRLCAAVVNGIFKLSTGNGNCSSLTGLFVCTWRFAQVDRVMYQNGKSCSSVWSGRRWRRRRRIRRWTDGRLLWVCLCLSTTEYTSEQCLLKWIMASREPNIRLSIQRFFFVFVCFMFDSTFNNSELRAIGIIPFHCLSLAAH